MKNLLVEAELEACLTELEEIQVLIDSIGVSAKPVPYLCRYAQIRACGSVEQAFKNILFDRASDSCNPDARKYLRKTILDSSTNPDYGKICEFLKKFDNNWNDDFKTNLSAHVDSARIKVSVKSLVDSRNSFAHGGSSTASISNTISYFCDASILLDVLDAVVSL